MSLTKDFVRYSVDPVFTREREKFTLKILFKLVFLNLFLAIGIIVVVYTIFYLAEIETPTHTVAVDKRSSPYFLFLIIFLAPLLEEIIFRSWLGNRFGIYIAMPVVLTLFSLFLVYRFSPEYGQLSLILFCGGIGIYFVAMKIRKFYWKEFHNTHFRFYFWASTIVFGLIHLTNYEMDTLTLAASLFILPQTVAGFIFGFARMRYGFVACFATHSVYNASVALLSISLS